MLNRQKTYSIVIVSLVVLFSVFCTIKLQDVRFNYDFETFFPNEDNELEYYNRFREQFEYDNEFVLLGIENRKGIFNQSFLTKVDSLTNELKRLEDIQRVVSPTNLKTIDVSGFVPVETKLLHTYQPDLYKEDSIAIYGTSQYVGSFFPADAKSLSVFVKTEDMLSKKRSDSLDVRIQRVFKKYKFDEVHYVGRIAAQNVYLNKLQSEFVYFLLISFCVVVIFLWLSFRSLYGIVVPVIIVLTSILWTIGIMTLLNKPIDIMTVMLPTMIFIAGMSDVVHFFSKYFEELSKGTEKRTIYPLILKEVGFPTFLTLITTVVGFLSLLFSSIQPIRDFGIYTSIGIIIAFILTYTLLPALLFLFTPKKLVSVHGQTSRLTNTMRTGLFWIFRNQRKIIAISCVVIALSIVGLFKVSVNNILLEDLSDKVKIKQDFLFFDKHYSGVRPLELAIELKDTTKRIFDYEVIQQLDKLEAFIKKEYDAGFLYSPVTIVKTANKLLNGGEEELPSKDDYVAVRQQINSNKKNKDLQRLVASDFKSARITSKIRDIGSSAIKTHNDHLQSYIAQHIDPHLFSITITGAAHLIDRNNEYMVQNMIQGFGFSFIVIAILTYLLHRNWRMVLVFLLPNFVPLLIIAGIMGFGNIELKAATSLVFSIAFGIATDDTIHFISRLKIELGYGKSLLYAFKRTYFETGKPIILTTFILIGGFMSLMISDFQSTFYFGFLVCITIIIAVLADIFLLPVLLFMILGKHYKSSTKQVEKGK